MTDANAAAAAAPGSADAPLKGILLLVFAASLLGFQDVVIRWLSGDYPVHQIVFVRSWIAIVPILFILGRDGGLPRLRTRRWPWHLLRGACAFGAYTSYYLAIAALPLAEAVAITFSAPLVVTALSAPVLGERVGARRWLGVVIGFAGVVVMLRPGLGAFEPAALLALAAAFFYAFTVIIGRRMGPSESSAAMAFYGVVVYFAASSLMGLVFGDGRFDTDSHSHASLGFLLRAWAVPTWHDFGLMALCGAIWGVTYYCIAQAYRITQASLVAPFEYVAMPWAAFYGWVFWSEVPDGLAFAGIALIVGGGLYVLQREHASRRRTVGGRPLRPRV